MAKQTTSSKKDGEGDGKENKVSNAAKQPVVVKDDVCPSCVGTGDNGIASSGGKCHCRSSNG